MDKSPTPKKEALAPQARQLEPLKATGTGLTISKSPVIGKSPRRPADPWLSARLNFLHGECSRLAAGPIVRRFLKEARARYKQYRGCGCPRLRYLCWSACNIVAEPIGRPLSRAISEGSSMSAQLHHVETGSAIMTLPGDQNAAEASVPVPLARLNAPAFFTGKFSASAMLRSMAPKEWAIGSSTKLSKFRFSRPENSTAASIATRESSPPTSDRGESGWTFTNNSHGNPLAAALAVLREVQEIGRRHRPGASALWWNACRGRGTARSAAGLRATAKGL